MRMSLDNIMATGWKKIIELTRLISYMIGLLNVYISGVKMGSLFSMFRSLITLGEAPLIYKLSQKYFLNVRMYHKF